MNVDWDNLVEMSKKYTKVVVSGPQRSGTTYTANELAVDLNYTYIDESEFGFSDFKKFLYKLNNMDRIVIQCPALAHKLHYINTQNSVVYYMVRPDKDIFKSENRINWNCYSSEFEHYLQTFPKYRDTITKFKKSATMKKFIWREIQKNLMQVDYKDVHYDVVKSSKNYISEEKRKNFSSKQISL